MNARKIIAVVGATGAQGGGLVRAIQGEPDSGFVARAITRDPQSDRARALADLGAEVVAADIDDPASLERALRGAYGAYLVTFYWAHLSPEQELNEARNLATAARTAGVEHAIWSTLEDTRRWVSLDDDRLPTLLGRYKVPHFDAKGEADRFFTDRGVPTTFLLTSFYWDNFIHFGMGPSRGADRHLAITLPIGEARLPGIAAEDIGRCALGIFKQGRGAIGRTIGIAGQHLTGAEMAAELGRARGQEVRYRAIEPAAYRALGFPGADDLGNMFQFNRDFERDFCSARDPEVARRLNPRLQDFRTWLAANQGRIPLAERSAQG